MRRSRTPTEHDLWVHEQAKKAFEGSVPALNDYLGKLLTLSSALIGGGFVAVRGDALPKVGGAVVMLILLFVALVAVIGLRPVPGEMQSPFLDHELFERFERGLIARKTVCARLASIGLLAGLLAAVVAVAFG